MPRIKKSAEDLHTKVLVLGYGSFAKNEVASVLQIPQDNVSLVFSRDQFDARGKLVIVHPTIESHPERDSLKDLVNTMRKEGRCSVSIAKTINV